MSTDKAEAQRLADALRTIAQWFTPGAKTPATKPDYAATCIAAADRLDALEAALRFYAAGDHFNLSDPGQWDTVTGEPQNFWCDDAGTATVEDGTVARMALAGTPLEDERIAALEAEVADNESAVRVWRGRTERAEAALEQARGALEPAKNGLAWYRDRHPEDADGSDDEADARIAAALRAIEEVRRG